MAGLSAGGPWESLAGAVTMINSALFSGSNPSAIASYSQRMASLGDQINRATSDYEQIMARLQATWPTGVGSAANQGVGARGIQGGLGVATGVTTQSSQAAGAGKNLQQKQQAMQNMTEAVNAMLSALLGNPATAHLAPGRAALSKVDAISKIMQLVKLFQTIMQAIQQNTSAGAQAAMPMPNPQSMSAGTPAGQLPAVPTPAVGQTGSGWQPLPVPDSGSGATGG